MTAASDMRWRNGYLRLFWSGHSGRIWLALAPHELDLLGSPWLAFPLWTPSTQTTFWDKWVCVHVEPFEHRIVFYVDLRADGGPEALTVEGAVPIADQIDPATQEFCDHMRTENDWNDSAPWER